MRACLEHIRSPFGAFEALYYVNVPLAYLYFERRGNARVRGFMRLLIYKERDSKDQRKSVETK